MLISLYENIYRDAAGMTHNGPLVCVESGGGAAHPGTNPGTLGRKFSRWTSHHGTAFANRASDVSFPSVGVLRVTL